MPYNKVVSRCWEVSTKKQRSRIDLPLLCSIDLDSNWPPMATNAANTDEDPPLSPTPSCITAITDSIYDVEKGYVRERQYM